MCGCFRNHRTVEVHQSSIPTTKRYQFVRPRSAKAYDPPPVTTVAYHPSREAKPVEDTFHPGEGEDLPLSTQHGGGRGGGQTQSFHPLPPILHQEPHPQPAPPGAPEPCCPSGPQHHQNQGPCSSSDHSTVIVDDRPEHVIARVPRRDDRGRRIVRAHRRSNPSSSRRDARGRGGQYYYYSASDGFDGSSDGDSWERVTVRGEWGDTWSDGGDSWDGKARQGRINDRRRRAIEWGGRTGRGRDGRRGGYYLH